MKMRMVFFLLIVCAAKLFGDGNRPKAKYFFATFNPIDSTFYVILDGMFYPEKKIESSNFRYWHNVINPTIIFESAFMKRRYSHPLDFELRKNKAEDDRKNRNYGSNYYDIWGGGFIPDKLGIYVGAKMLIALPGKAGAEWQEILPVQKFQYYCSKDQIVDLNGYLVVKTGKITNTAHIDNLKKNNTLFVAIYRGTYAVTKIDTALPAPVQAHYDSSRTFRSRYWQEKRREFNSMRNNRQLTFETYLNTPYNRKQISIQPLAVNMPQQKNQRRFLLVSAVGGKGFIGETTFIDENGKQLPPPIISTRRGVIIKCRGIVRISGAYGTEDIVVCDVSLGDYNGGVSILKQTSDGNLKEILFLQTYFD